MAYFANIDKNIVTEVIVIADEDCGGGIFPESEPIGQTFIASLGFTGEWLQTSITGEYRGCYAGIGYKYNSKKDVFVEPIPAPIEGA